MHGTCGSMHTHVDSKHGIAWDPILGKIRQRCEALKSAFNFSENEITKEIIKLLRYQRIGKFATMKTIKSHKSCQTRKTIFRKLIFYQQNGNKNQKYRSSSQKLILVWIAFSLYVSFRNTKVENKEPNEDRSQDDRHPDLGPSVYQSRHSKESDPDEAPHRLTRVQGEIRYRPHMVTGSRDEIPYCSPETSSGKPKKACSTSQPQFRKENTPATIEADQVLLALQLLATNSSSTNFNNSINRISKLPKSLTTTMPTFDGK